MKKEKYIRKIRQGTLTVGEGSVQLTSSLTLLVLKKENILQKGKQLI
jgi:hypothetical protein